MTRVVVNGAEREFSAVETVTDLLRELNVDERMVVVELNRAIVRRPALGETPVRSGDQIELVHFVGGG
jgi:thiamine biosynthesis protein ThiS